MIELQSADPWEGVAGWASGPRNDAWLALLRRRAPGARVLEWGAGAGVWGIVAARLGARQVIVVEPTDQADVARELVRANQLQAVVEVREGTLASHAPIPVDLAFTARIGPDPFADGLPTELVAAARWVVPGGCLAPRKIRVWGALAEVTWTGDEAAAARSELDAWSKDFNLDFGAVRRSLDSAGPYRLLTEIEDPIGPAQLIWEVLAGGRPRPRIVQMATDAGSSGGAVQWCEVELDEGIVLGGPPGTGSPWPTLVCGWTDRVESPKKIRWTTVGGRIIASPVG